MVVPQRAYDESALSSRVAASRARVQVQAITGSRVAFQIRSFLHLWRIARQFDVILSQEMLRGSLNATIVGALCGVPVVTAVSMPALEYFRCRRERKRIGAVSAWVGERIIRMLLAINGRLATQCIALGPYLMDVVKRTGPRTEPGYYYGVDIRTFRPADAAERAAIRRRLDLPADKFLVVFASRISHEKDPETVLQAVARARARGLDAVLL